jgi:hypothetical protein
MPSMVVTAELAEANVVNGSVFAGAVEFSAGGDAGSAGAAKAIETTSAETKNKGEFKSIRVTSGQRAATMKKWSEFQLLQCRLVKSNLDPT